MAEETKAKRIRARYVAIAVLVVALLCAVGFAGYVSDYYHAGEEADSLVSAGIDDAGSAISESDSSISVGDASSEYGVVLYPGAKVDARAYVPLACKFADRGIYCVIAKMPFNLAIFNTSAADGLLAEAPQVQHWWLAGHSLGGAMGSQYVSKNSVEFEGIAFLGAYASADLSSTDLKALTIYGENDSVLNRGKLASNEANLPANAQTIVIVGGNHAGFADYGPQQGDDEALIPASQQQQQTADAIVSAMCGQRRC